MERFRKYIQVGTSNVILADITIKPGCKEWLSFEKYKVIEEKLSRQLQAQLSKADLERPGILSTISGEVVMGVAKFTYNLRERRNSRAHLMVTGTGTQKQWKKVREGHVDDSITKYRNYGGLFKKLGMIRAELVVTIECLPVSLGKENTDTKSSYFKDVTGTHHHTPQKMKMLKQMVKDKDHRKRKLSGSDTENNVVPTSKAQSVLQSLSSHPPKVSEDSPPGKAMRNDQRYMLNHMESSQRKEKQSVPEGRERRNAVTEVQQKAKESEGKQHDTEITTTDADSAKNPVKATSKQKDFSAKPGDISHAHCFKRMRGSGCVNPTILGLQDFPHESVGAQSISVSALPEGNQRSTGVRKMSQKESRKDSLVQRECHAEKLSHKEDRQEYRNKSNERRTLQKEVKKRSCETETRPPKKSSLIKKNKEEGLKKLLTDCGLSDSESGEENASKKKKTSSTETQSQQRKSEHFSTLQALQRHSELMKEYKRESLEDFELARTKMQKKPGKIRKFKTSTSLCKSLFASDDDDEENVKKSRVVDDGSSVIHKKADLYKGSYSPTPKKMNEDDLYVPTVMQRTQKEDGPALLGKPHLLPEEYFPTAISPIKAAAAPACTVRGKYEEYVPQAINSVAKQQLQNIDYVPTPKKDNPQDKLQSYDLNTGQNELYDPESQDYAPPAESSSDAMPGQLEAEIRSIRNVKDLTDSHIEYLFNKYVPEIEGIIENKICSWRNDIYRHGGIKKRMLTFQVFSSPFSRHQIDIISLMFMDEYAAKRKLTGDYLNQVLLPEFLIRVYMTVHGTSHEESDRLMAMTPCEMFPMPTHT